MLYLIPTKKGIGIQLWGTYSDLDATYEVVSKYLANEDSYDLPGKENRAKLISSFTYEIRKAKENSRLEERKNHFYPFEESQYLGVEISWVHILFSLTAIKYEMSCQPTSKFELSIIFQIEHWLKKAMYSYDVKGAALLEPFIDDGLHGGNPYIYHYMRQVNMNYYLLGGGKRSFRQLPELLKTGVLYTDSFKSFQAELEAHAKRLGCRVNDLEIHDDHIDYDSIKW